LLVWGPAGRGPAEDLAADPRRGRILPSRNGGREGSVAAAVSLRTAPHGGCRIPRLGAACRRGRANRAVLVQTEGEIICGARAMGRQATRGGVPRSGNGF